MYNLRNKRKVHFV